MGTAFSLTDYARDAEVLMACGARAGPEVKGVEF